MFTPNLPQTVAWTDDGSPRLRNIVHAIGILTRRWSFLSIHKNLEVKCFAFLAFVLITALYENDTIYLHFSQSSTRWGTGFLVFHYNFSAEVWVRFSSYSYPGRILSQKRLLFPQRTWERSVVLIPTSFRHNNIFCESINDLFAHFFNIHCSVVRPVLK